MDNAQLFHDRIDAGRRLATALHAYASRADVLVLGLPRGGVPVAAEVARVLQAPLDALLVRKLGLPGQEELALGAIALGGTRVLNRDVIRASGISAVTIEAVTAAEQRELARRDRLYREERPAPVVRGRIVILVDDGLATGASMYAALTALRPQQPAKLVVAVPVGPAATCRQLGTLADEVVCLYTPELFYALGPWYEDFAPPTDATVRNLLAAGAPRPPVSQADPPAA
jgi:predicted phosphoribosyltransferase